MITITVDEKHRSTVANGGQPLKNLCQEEVANFDRYLRGLDSHAEFKAGLSKFERLAIEGYLYQKLRGHLDPSPEPDDLPG